MPNGEVLRAAIIAVVNAFIPMLQVLEVVDLEADEVAAVSAFVTTLTALVFLFYKGGTTATPPV